VLGIAENVGDAGGDVTLGTVLLTFTLAAGGGPDFVAVRVCAVIGTPSVN
jgi:hypothetical protein